MITQNVTGLEYHTREQLIRLLFDARVQALHQAKIAEERHKMIEALEKENEKLREELEMAGCSWCR